MAVARFVAAIGDNCLDIYQTDPRRVAVGGNALNVAVNLRRQGLHTRYLGAVGDDANGRLILDALQAVGVEADVEIRSGPTAVTEIALRDGERHFLREEYGVMLDYAPGKGSLDALRDAAWVHAARIPHPAALLSELHRRALPASYDFDFFPIPKDLTGLGIAFVPAEAQQGRSPATIAHDLVARGAGTAVVLRGPQGSLAYDGNDIIALPALRIAVTDTLGAGDSYIAAFIAARLAGAGLRQSMEAATAAAAATCRIVGAWPQSFIG